MTSDDKDEEERRIAEVMQIAESLATGERRLDDVHDGYTRLGTATLGTFRFKWIAREQSDGRFVVEETVGSSSIPVVSRELLKDEVLGYVEDRQTQHRLKLDDIRREWAVEPAPAVQKVQPAPVRQVESRDPAEMYDVIRQMLKDGK